MSGYDIFRQLQGTWTLDRKIVNIFYPELSGNVHGKAYFSPDSTTKYYVTELGVFKTTTKAIFVATEQLYFLDEDQAITIHSARDRRSITPLFRLRFPESKQPVYKSTAQHLCGDDTYDANYEFHGGDALSSFNVTYVVKGPDKNYTSTTSFNRPAITGAS